MNYSMLEEARELAGWVQPHYDIVGEFSLRNWGEICDTEEE
jgi:hypothetical protein